jgi:hypothetical protein
VLKIRVSVVRFRPRPPPLSSYMRIIRMRCSSPQFARDGRSSS